MTLVGEERAAGYRGPVRNPLRSRLRHLPSGLIGSAGALVVGVIIGGALRGPAGAAGVAAGVALVSVGYVLSSLVVAWADSIAPNLVMPVGLTAYVGKVIVFGVVMAAIARTDWAGLAPMGWAIVGSALVWIVALSWWTWNAKILYVDPAESSGPSTPSR